MPNKKSPKKKTSAKKSPAKKVTAKKVTKKTVAKKVAPKAAPKAASKKTAPRKAAKGATTAKGSKAKRKASEIIKKSSHTPAIFKTNGKRHLNVLFSLEDVRKVLVARAAEEKLESQATAPSSARKVPAKKVALEETPARTSKHQAASLDDILGIGTGGGQGGGHGSVPRKWAKYHSLLIELRDHVRDELNLHSSDTLKRSQKEDAGDISISVDAGTDNFDRDFALSLLSSEQESLKEIEAAIQRIYKGTYGTCEVTGEPIKPERLEAVPFTRFSLEGQREHESNSRKRVSRAGAFLNEGSGEAISFGDDDDN
ncbi:MAG: TraR/DksA family transcriptional regulator [Opitutales bacterium]|jgi:RNA polymerase-binding transcription factor DksA